VLIGGGNIVESGIRAGFTDRLVGKMVQQIRGSVEPHLSSSKLRKKPERVGSESYYLW
jgi:hypothetical protein